jgi:hypothetical protein
MPRITIHVGRRDQRPRDTRQVAPQVRRANQAQAITWVARGQRSTHPGPPHTRSGRRPTY